MIKPLVSIIITHFNNEYFTVEAIKSITNQVGVDPKEIEIIISSDNDSQNLAKKFIAICPRVKFYVNKSSHGPGYNRENGLKHAKGIYIYFLDADDKPNPNFLIDSLQLIGNSKDAVATVCLSHIFFNMGFPLKKRYKIYLFSLVKNILLWCLSFINRGNLPLGGFYLCQLSHMLFRKVVVNKIHFNPDYTNGGEDWDYVIQTAKYGSIKILPKLLLDFRYSVNSVSQKTSRNRLKTKSYKLLTSRISDDVKSGMLYRLFVYYYNHFII